MVTPIAQMWKLRPRQVRVSTLGQVLHPQGLLCSATCGVRVTRGPRCAWLWFLHPPRDNHPHCRPQSIQLSHRLCPPAKPLPPHTHTMAQYSSISAIWTKCLLGSRHFAGCHPSGEQDKPAVSDRCPTPTTHINAYSNTRHSMHRHPHRSNNSPPHTHTVVRTQQEVLHTPQSSTHSPT